MRKLFALLREHPEITDRHAWATDRLQRAGNDQVTTYRALTEKEIGRLISSLEYPELSLDGVPSICGEVSQGSRPCILPSGAHPDGWCVDEFGNTWVPRY